MTSADGRDVADLLNALELYKAGAKVKLTLWRSGETRVAEVVLGEHER